MNETFLRLQSWEMVYLGLKPWSSSVLFSCPQTRMIVMTKILLSEREPFLKEVGVELGFHRNAWIWREEWVFQL